MTTWLAWASALLISALAAGQSTITIGQSQTQQVENAQRTLKRADGFFIVEYAYSTGYFFTLSTSPPGQPHYDATITVYRVIDGKKRQIGQPFPGQYTVGGCFEDDPKSLIEYALKHKDDASATVNLVPPLVLPKGTGGVPPVTSGCSDCLITMAPEMYFYGGKWHDKPHPHPEILCPHDGEESEEVGMLLTKQEESFAGLKRFYFDGKGPTIMLCPSGHLWARKAKP